MFIALYPESIPVVLQKKKLLANSLKAALRNGSLTKELMSQAIALVTRKSQSIQEDKLLQACELALEEKWKIKDSNLRRLLSDGSKKVLPYILSFANPLPGRPAIPILFRRYEGDGALWIELLITLHGFSDRHALLLETARKGGASIICFDEAGREVNTLKNYLGGSTFLNGKNFRKGDLASYEVGFPENNLTQVQIRLPAALVTAGLVGWKLSLVDCTPSMYFRYPMILEVVVRALF